MKKIILILSLLVLFSVFIFITSKPNPVAFYFFNEFMFDSSGWKLELHPTDSMGQDSISLDGWYLTSKTDTGYFKSNIYISNDRYTIITQLDLQNQLTINTEGDVITLFDDNEIRMDLLCLGIPDNSYFTQIPLIGQSTCFLGSAYNYYLDNTPTFGFENDTLNANGNIKGFVKDSLNNPIEGVRVIYGYRGVPGGGYDTIYVETNSIGYFDYLGLSVYKWFKFEKEGYFAPDTSIQIWPDSTVTINIQMQAVVGVTELPSPSVNSFELSQNYPNPFNSSTSFNYSLSEDGYLEINIYDEKGELVQKLFNGNQTKGQYTVNWRAENLASGIYFYELFVRTPSEKTTKQKLSKKCLLLK